MPDDRQEYVMPTPRGDETRNDFLGRCMGDDVMRQDYPRLDQRMAVCITQWTNGMEESFREFSMEAIASSDPAGSGSGVPAPRLHPKL